MDTQLTCINFQIYKPIFDERTGIFVDSCPYKLYERDRITYECRCKAGSSFTSRGEFNQHIRSMVHKDFIKYYDKYYKEVDEAAKTINELKIDNELLKRRSIKLQDLIDSLNDYIKQLKESIAFIDKELNSEEFFDAEEPPTG